MGGSERNRRGGHVSSRYLGESDPPWASLRRIRIDRVQATAAAVVSLIVAAALGFQSAAEDVSPTGAPGTDIVVVALFSGALGWAGASASLRAIIALGGVAAAISWVSPWTIAAVLATLVGVALHVLKRDAPWLRSAATGSALLALMQADVNPFFGASAVIVGAVCIGFATISVARRPRPIRRRAVWTVVGCAGLGVLAVAGLAIGVLQARDDLEAGADRLTDGFDQLRAGDTAGAAAALRSAAHDLRRASGSVGAIWTQPSRLLPGVAQHRAVLSRVVADAADSALAAADALDAADFDTLRVVDGTLDVAALARLAQPLADLDAAVQGMTETLQDADSPWLIGEVRDQLATGLDEIEEAAVQSRAIAAAARVGPVMLGLDGTRTYLVVFTSPGEARGQSGLISNWAEIQVTDGRIRETDYGRTSELIDVLTEPGASATDTSDLVLDASPEYFARYAPFGAGGPGVPVLPSFWSNVTMSPDTPTAAAVMAQMYERASDSGIGGSVDGVIVIDATGLASLLSVAGPVRIEELDRDIDAESLEQFLLLDQYTLDDATRRAAVEAVAGLTLQQFLSVSLPEPQQLTALLGPAATEGHIVGWAKQPEEQELFRLIGMDGELPEPDGRDGLAVVTDNAGGNAIDTFLERKTSYSATYDPESGRVEAELVVSLHNAAPSSGYPSDVIGNDLGLPAGTNRTLLTIYTPLEVQAATVDDEPSRPDSITTGTERGWNTKTIRIDLAAGQTRTLRFSMAGTVSAGGYAFIWRAQPMARPDPLVVDVVAADGGREVSFSGELPRLTILDRDGKRALR